MGRSASRKACNSANHALDRSAEVQSPYLKAKGAVEYLQLPSVDALDYHIRENRLPVCRSLGGLRRFDKRELDAWIRNTTSIEMDRDRRKSERASR
jgi:predicted DNA-binding transcriptional regulator AlpA